MRGKIVRQTCTVCGCPELEMTTSWNRRSASTIFSRSPVFAACSITQISLPSSAKSASVIRVAAWTKL